MLYPLGHGAASHLQRQLVCCIGVRLQHACLFFHQLVELAFALCCQTVPVLCAVVRVWRVCVRLCVRLFVFRGYGCCASMTLWPSG